MSSFQNAIIPLGHYLLKTELKDDNKNVTIDSRNFFDQPVRNRKIDTKIQYKIIKAQVDNYK